MTHGPRRRRPFRSLARTSHLLLAVTVAAMFVAGCGGSDATTAASSGSPGQESPSVTASSSPGGASAATEPVRTTPIGVTVTGDVGDKPALTVPSGPAPTTLLTEVLVAGSGPVVAKGQTLVVDYLGQTWKPKAAPSGDAAGEPNVFDNSYDRGAPAGFPIGVGRVIKGWDTALVGQKVGSRVLLSVPPEQAYGTDAKGHELGGQTLLFVVDLLGSLGADVAADGAAVTKVPDGFPKVSSTPGKEPAITSVAGVSVPEQSRSTLLVTGAGAAISPTSALALQLVQTDTATGKQTQKTWGGNGIQLVPAEDVLNLATALQDQKVGSRALVVTADQGSGSNVLIIDVVAQF